MKKSKDYLLRMLDLGKAISTEKDPNKLFKLILTESRNITNCEAGTLYIKKNDELLFSIIENEKINKYNKNNIEDITLPPVNINSKSVCAYVARTKKIVNIGDVYSEDSNLLEVSKKYDKLTGYRTKSMLVLPLIDYEDNVIGVMQLINAKDHDDNVIPFLKYHEKIISYHGSQGAIFLSNINYLKEIHDLFDSFVRMMVKAIDRKARYNAHHTRNVVKYLDKFINYINTINIGPLAKEYFNKERKEELLMSAWLHDIGKINIPLNIMNKATRLGLNYNNLINRIKLEIKDVRILELEGNIDKKEAQDRISFLQYSIDKINEYNEPYIYIDDDKKRVIDDMYSYITVGENDKIINEEEYEQLNIRKGSLTESEKEIMNSHVSITREMLNEIPFIDKFSHVKEWASKHHEKLNGTGYPDNIKENDIPFEVRILTIIDIYEALTSNSRPYKKAIDNEKTFEILYDMAKNNEIDITILNAYKDSEAWI